MGAEQEQQTRAPAEESEASVAAMQEQMEAMKKLLDQQTKQLAAFQRDGGPPSSKKEPEESRARGRPPRDPARRVDVAPSKVLHLRNTPKDVTVAEIETLFGEEFGPCVKVVPLPGKPQALVELTAVDKAKRALQHFEHSKVAQIRTNRIYFNFSHRSEIEDTRDPVAAAAAGHRQAAGLDTYRRLPSRGDNYQGDYRGRRRDEDHDEEPRRRPVSRKPGRRRDEEDDEDDDHDRRPRPAPRRAVEDDFDDYDDYDDDDLDDMRPKNRDQLRTVAEWIAYVRGYRRRRRDDDDKEERAPKRRRDDDRDD